MNKAEIRERLVRELAEANRSVSYSREMVSWIEAGTLALPRIHSDLAHQLAKQLLEEK